MLDLPSDFSLSSDPEAARLQQRALIYLDERDGRYLRRFFQDVGLLKINWRAGQQSLSASWNRHRFDFSNAANIGPLQSREHTGLNRQVADSVAVSLTSQLGPTAVNVARFSYVGNHDPQDANTYVPETNVVEGKTVLLVGRSPRLPVTLSLAVWENLLLGLDAFRLISSGPRPTRHCHFELRRK